MDEAHDVWLLKLYLQTLSGHGTVSRSEADEFLDRIMELAEARALAVGGMLRPLTDEDTNEDIRRLTDE